MCAYYYIETILWKVNPGKIEDTKQQAVMMQLVYKWNLHGGKTTMLYLNLSGHNIFKKRFGTSPEKHCLTDITNSYEYI